MKGRIGPLISIELGNFLNFDRDIENSSVIFFNNFGQWFTPDDPERSLNPCALFCEQVS